MKKKKEELDVDFIGGVRPLTKEDEQAISEYLRSKKSQQARKLLRSASFHLQKRATA